MRDRRLTGQQLQAQLNTGRSKEVSVSTVKRRLRAAGLTGRVAVRKPLLRWQNKKKRLAWVMKHHQWTTENWKKVFWTDESKFEIFVSSRSVFVRCRVDERMVPQCVTPTVKHGGGSVMIWGLFCWIQSRRLAQSDWHPEPKGLPQHFAAPCNTLCHAIHLCLVGQGFIIQQDNDPTHTSGLCQNYL